jgi:putative ABC transport system permease protein
VRLPPCDHDRDVFIAIRDLRFARGRFALLGTVVGLMTVMVVLLGGLTAGLSRASVSAVSALPTSHVAFERPVEGESISFDTSSLSAGTVATVAGVPGVVAAYPIGVVTTRLQAAERTSAVVAIGTPPDVLPTLVGGSVPGDGEVAVTADIAADQHLDIGTVVRLGGESLRVSGVTQTTSLSHLPVVYSDVATWHRVARTDAITAVAVDPGSATTDEIDAAAGTTTVDRPGAYAAVGGFVSEQGSLTLMRWLLVGISVLVVGAFFLVWTMQRHTDLAVVRAIGGSRRFLLGDALAQALLVLVAGAAVGAAVAAGLGVLAQAFVPLHLSVATVLVPLVTMVVAGLVGAAASVRSVVTVDPLAAMGGHR